MPAFETIEYQAQNGVARLMLNRPRQRNALNARMVDELIEAIARIRADEGIRAVVLHGAGGAFCAGGDLRDTGAAGPRTPEQGEHVMARYQRLVRALHGLNRPVVAAVQGAAYGAGFSLLLLADIVLLGEDARLCMVFQRVGMVPDCGALYTLPRAVGLQRAKELMFSAREIGAREAQSMGLALEVLAGVDLLPRALEMALAFCGASPTTLSATKQALDASLQSELEMMLTREASIQGVALSTAYVAEAARRFALKEVPQFLWPLKRVEAAGD